MSGTVSYVTVTLKNLNHGWAGDVDVLLVGPSGQTLRLMENACSGQTINSNLTFSDNAPFMLPPSGAVISGTYRPSAYAPAMTYPAPAPAAPYGTNLAVFNVAEANGTWSLYVIGWRRGRLRQLNWWMGAGYLDNQLCVINANSYTRRNPIANAYSYRDSESGSDRNADTNANREWNADTDGNRYTCRNTGRNSDTDRNATVRNLHEHDAHLHPR